MHRCAYTDMPVHARRMHIGMYVSACMDVPLHTRGTHVYILYICAYVYVCKGTSVRAHLCMCIFMQRACMDTSVHAHLLHVYMRAKCVLGHLRA